MSYPKTTIGRIAKVKKNTLEELVTIDLVAYIRARDIRDGIINFDDPVYVTEQGFKKIKNYTVEVRDVHNDS